MLNLIRRLARNPNTALIVTGVVAAVFGALLTDPVKHVLWPPPDPIAEQFEKLRKGAGEHGRIVVEIREVALHPPTVSYLVRTQPRAGGKGALSSSDTVLVYDKDDGELARKFRFRPVRVEGEKRHRAFRYVLIPGTPLPRSRSDLDRDGVDEVVGYWRTDSPVPATSLLYPFAIEWNAHDGRYVQRALLGKPTVPLLDLGAASNIIKAYGRAATLINGLPDRPHDSKLFGATALAFTNGHTDLPVLLSGYVVRVDEEEVDVRDDAVDVRVPRTVQVAARPLDFMGDTVNDGLCAFISAGDTGITRTNRPVGPEVLWREWKRMRRVTNC